MSETDTRLISHEGDKHTTYKWDHEGHYVINHVQDVEPYLERNKALSTSGWDGYDKSRDFRHVGTVPDVIAYRWLTVHGVNLFDPGQQDGVRRLFNDPDYAFLRSSPGKV